MSLDEFVAKAMRLIANGSFAELGVPQIRIEGTIGRRPQLICGLLFHAAKKKHFTFHDDALSATGSLWPLFRTWSSARLANLSMPVRRASALDSASRPDPDSLSFLHDDEVDD